MEEVSLNQPNVRPSDTRIKLTLDDFVSHLKRDRISAGTLVLSIVLAVIGIILLCCINKSIGKEESVDYTNCMGFDKTSSCAEVLNYNPTEDCVCYLNITLKAPIYASDGDIIVYYELDTYMLNNRSYQDSRDPKQLSGILGKPSDACKPYDYLNTTEGRKPIAPCGAVADAMFTDSFKISLKTPNGTVYLQQQYTGLVSEAQKALYHNPPGDIKEALRNFSKPISWNKELWQLDTMNPENNGFQNEPFIAWMDTSAQRKAAWRINTTGYFQTGLPADVYNLKIQYAYPPSRYSGVRRLVVGNYRTYVSTGLVASGIILLLLGLTGLALTFILYLRSRQQHK